MKKRIVCVLLTLIMLLSLVPMGASAANRAISAAAITVLKQMTTLKTVCYYHSGSEFRTGYGTVCEEEHHFDTDGNPDNTDDQNEHTITEKNADIALRKALAAYDEKVNAFASANGLSLKQNQHDALVVFSYNAGTGWMDGNGVVKSAIINKADATELLNAMNQWTKNADLSRRKVEVNMYFNGIYSNVAPSTYSSVVYKSNGGSMPQADYGTTGKYTFYFDSKVEMDHPVTPTKNGSVFVGWYKESGSVISWVPKLNSSSANKTLVAKWQTGYLEEDAVEVNYQLHKNHLASTKVYSSIFSEKHSNSRTENFADYLADNDKLFWVDADMIDNKGVRWSHLNSAKTVANGKMIDGWVKVGAATDNDSYTDSYGTVIATATVTANGYLNLRSDAGTDHNIVGALAKNDTVDIYEIKTVNGHQWGRCKSGWLCLTYTRLLMKDDVSVSNVGAKTYAFTGMYNGKADLYVYSEPNTKSNYAQYTVPHMSNPKLDGGKADLYIPGKDTRNSSSGISVTMTNFFMVNGELWVKATWKNPEWKWKSTKITDGTKEVSVSRSGWVKFSKIAMDPAKFTVAAESVNVRAEAGDAAALSFTLNKGVQIVVDEIALVNENIWGHFDVKLVNHVGVEEAKEGWVNLASKYFTRDGAPSVEVEEDDSLKNMVATVINTDSLKVRKTGATYGQQIGRLTRGTTVAVWESNGKGWYKVDSNKNGVYDYKEDGWCSEKYLDIHKNTVSSTVTDSSGNSYTTDGTGKGIVANTYSGVNVRTGPSTAYATNGKLLPGTVVDILETKNGGKWGRVAQGWISMDYVTMVSYNEVIPETEAPNGGSYVGSYDDAEKTTTTAVYTGTLDSGIAVFRTPTKDEKKAEVIRTTTTDENVTIYELAKVTENITSDVTDGTDADGNVTTTTTTTTITTYWARINDGWVQDPEDCLSLTALDEKLHTQTSVEKLNVRKGTNTEADESGEVFDVLIRGEQVTVTALDIIKDKVWGRVDTNEGTGWIRLDYMSEGAIYVKPTVQNNTTTAPSAPVLGQGSSAGGYVNNSSGYRYTGKVIRANEVNVRATPSTGASKTTSLKNGQALVIYETTIAENMAWGRCDAGWIYLYYVDLTPVVNGAVDARVVYNDNTIIYTDVNCTSVAGTYSRMSTIDIYEIVGKMARTEQGWVNVDNLL